MNVLFDNRYTAERVAIWYESWLRENGAIKTVRSQVTVNTNSRMHKLFNLIFKRKVELYFTVSVPKEGLGLKVLFANERRFKWMEDL